MFVCGIERRGYTIMMHSSACPAKGLRLLSI